MKRFTALSGIFSLLLFGFLAGCNQKPAPLKEGVIWSVKWSDGSGGTTGLYRTDKPMPGQGGSYGVDLRGLLYPSYLEVQLVGSRDSHSQIIPISQILWLEFGEGKRHLPVVVL